MRTVTNLWRKLPDPVRRVLHTAWQVALATTIINLSNPRSSTDIKSALLVGVAAGLAVLKGYLVSLTK